MRVVFSRVLRHLDEFSSRAFVAALVLGGVVAFFVVGLARGMRQSWEVWFSTVATAITLVMVFAIQHTQKREQAVTQLKLDELLKALPDADDRVTNVEASSDARLHDLRQGDEALRGGP